MRTTPTHDDAIALQERLNRIAWSCTALTTYPPSYRLTDAHGQDRGIHTLQAASELLDDLAARVEER